MSEHVERCDRINAARAHGESSDVGLYEAGGWGRGLGKAQLDERAVDPEHPVVLGEQTSSRLPGSASKIDDNAVGS